MNRTPSLSIIVPVYQVEAYLPKCIDSIINQTFTDLELILVDDGSTDGCPQLCDEYKQKDSRIKVIHKENGGLSDARNKGIEIAVGKYLGFVDSDDWIELGMYEVLMSDAIKHDADISCCGFNVVKNNISKPYNHSIKKYSVFRGNEVFPNLYTEFSACNKIYKKELFDKTRYPVGKFYEDARIMYLLAEQAKVFIWNPIPMYSYVFRVDSIMQSFDFNKCLDRVVVWEELYDNVLVKHDELKKNIIARKNKLIVDLFTDIAVNHIQDIHPTEILLLKKKIKGPIVFNRELNIVYGAKCFLIKYTPSIYIYICKKKKSFRSRLENI